MSATIIGNRYQLQSRLGEGGMGTVYQGLDIQTNEPIAIKHLKPELLASDSQMLIRFARESDALRQLNHPHIVKALATVEEDGNHYIILEFVGGGSLADVLRTETALPINRVLNIALDLSDGLTRAHRLNIIHRDIKPANVLLADDGTPRLTDFGIAFVRGKERVTETNAIVGTLDYLSPEAFQTPDADARGDIWAFGVLLFEMIGGKRPFDRPTMSQTMMAILNEPPTDLEVLRPDCPIALVDLIYRMLEKDPQQRIPSVRQVSAELENILQGRSATSARHVAVEQDTPTPTPAAKHNLPAQSTPFVGREDEIAELTRTLSKAEVRLVTILAPGGMGKTRLALETAERQLPHFSNGVYFVPLAPLTSPDFIVSTIAESVGFQFYQGGEPQQQLLDYLREKSLLLIMDNFEHVLNGAGIVSQILHTAPHVKIIVTSRERLNLGGETLFALDGMDFPKWETPQDALDYAAVKLFMSSARRVRPDFELTADDLTYGARICRLVVGMPLGIVLAAAWLEMLSLKEISEEIEKSIDFLETEMRDIPERHRSIRAVFDYSWNLLNDDERAVFMKLSVFRGGFTREAAQAVAGASLKSLMSLVNKSLLRRDANTGRYEVHELLRQYGEEQLTSSIDASEVREDHSWYYARWLQSHEEKLKGHEQITTLQSIKIELDNIESGWLYAVNMRHETLLLTQLNTLTLFLSYENVSAQITTMMSKAIAAFVPPSAHEVSRLWGRLLIRYSELLPDTLSQMKTDYFEVSLKIAESYNDDSEIAFCHFQYAIDLHTAGNSAAAKPHIEAALHLYRQLGDHFWIARTLFSEGWIHWHDPEKQVELQLQAYQLFQDLGNKIEATDVLTAAVYGVAFTKGDFVTGEQYAEQAHKLALAIGRTQQIIYAKMTVSWTALWHSDYEKVRTFALDCIRLAEDLHSETSQIHPLVQLCFVKCLDDEDYQSGLELGMKARGFAQSVDDFGLTGVAIALALCGQSKIEEAARYARPWLEFRPGVGKLNALPIFAVALAHRGRLEQATEILSFCEHYPMSMKWMMQWSVMVNLKSNLRKRLGAETFDIAWQRGKFLDLNTVVTELLAES